MLIVNTVSERYHTNYKTIIVVEDVDLVPPTSKALADNKIYFLKSRKGKTERKIYSIKSLNYYTHSEHHILLIHAISNCDAKNVLSCSKMEKTSRIIVMNFSKTYKLRRKMITENEIRLLLAIYNTRLNKPMNHVQCIIASFLWSVFSCPEMVRK